MRNHRFTLIEVVVAIGILGLALSGLLQLLIQSQERLARNFDRWNRMHMLMQAAEFTLLQPGEEPPGISREFFPYDDYRVIVSFRDAEGLPDELNDQVGQLPLKSCVIELIRARDGKTVDQLIVDRISYETTVQEE